MPSGTGAAAWLQEFVTIGILAAGVGGGWLMADDDLAWELRGALMTNTEDSFDTAKQTLFNQIDPEPNDQILTRYSGTMADLGVTGGVLHPDPDEGVQVEHTWASAAKWAHSADHFARSSVPGADLHHLFAVRQGINGSRGNHPFGELPNTARELRIDADGSLNHSGGGTASGSFRDQNAAGVTVFEPRGDHKGDVARAMFYMSVRYWMPIPQDMEDDLKDWHTEDPVDAEEIARNDRIEAVQGNRNPFVDRADLVDEISNF